MKKAGSLSSATLTASEMPARQSRSVSVVSRSKSFSTACGGANEPTKFFLPNALMPFLTPTAESSCAQHRRRHADQPHPAVGGRRGVADHVEHRAAADRHHVGVAVDAVGVDRGADLVDRTRLVLDRLAAGYHERRRGQLERVGVGGAVDGHVGGHSRVGVGDALVDHDEEAGAILGLDHVAQRVVERIEQPVGELHGVAEGDDDLLVDVRQIRRRAVRAPSHTSVIPHCGEFRTPRAFGESSAKLPVSPTESPGTDGAEGPGGHSLYCALACRR